MGIDFAFRRGPSFWGVVLLVALVLPTFAAAQSSPNTVDQTAFKDVTIETARQVATFECISRYGDFPEFANVTYFDGNDLPAVYVFVFAKSDRFGSEAALERHLAVATEQYNTATTQADRNSAKANLALRDDFVTLYVSATTSRTAVPESRDGLPEYYANYGRLQALTGHASYQRKFYYFGAGQVFFQGTPGGSAISVSDPSDKLSASDLARASYRFPSVERDAATINRLKAQWGFFINTVGAQDVHRFISPRRDARTDHLLGDALDDDNLPPPDFDEGEYLTTIFLNGDADAVLAHASALAWYDNPLRNYWNLVDLAVQDGGSTNGFTCDAGLIDAHDMYSPTNRIEAFLSDLATDMGYDFDNGGTPADPTTGIETYTNTTKGLDFAVSYNDYGVPFAKIQADIDAGNPVVISVANSLNANDDGATGHSQYGDPARTVCVVGYATNSSDAEFDGISQPVYVNANNGDGVYLWDFSDLTGVKSWEYTAGGDAGDFFPKAANHTAATKYSLSFDITWTQVTVNDNYPETYVLQWSTDDFTDAANTHTVSGIVAPEDPDEDVSVSITAADGDVVKWHVTAVNSDGFTCQYSDVATATVDVQLYPKPDNSTYLPAADFVKKTRNVTFSWNAEKVTEPGLYGVDVYAHDYDFVFDTIATPVDPADASAECFSITIDPNEESPVGYTAVTNDAGVLSTTITLPDSSDHWFWKLAARNDNGDPVDYAADVADEDNEFYTDDRSFAAYTVTFPRVTLTTPEDAMNSTSDKVTFEWEPVTVDGEVDGPVLIYPTDYLFEYSEDDPLFEAGPTTHTETVTDENLDGTSLTTTLTGLTEGRYYWRVSAVKEDASLSSASVYRNFKVLATDVRINSVALSNSVGCLPNSTVTVKSRIENAGSYLVSGFRYSVYWSLDATLEDDEDVLLGEATIDELLSGDTELLSTQKDSVQMAVTIPEDAVSGEAYILVLLDNFYDSNTANNFVASRVTLAASDIQITAATAKPALVEVGKKTTLDFTFKNAGSGAAAASHAKLYWSEDNALDDDDVLIKQSPSLTDAIISVPALARNATNVRKLDVIVPASYTGLTGYILIDADCNDEVIELNESNNTRAILITIARANLRVVTATLSRTEAGKTIVVKQMQPSQYNLAITGQFNNNGKLSARNFHVNVYRSTDNVWDEDDLPFDGATHEVTAAASVGKTYAMTKVYLSKDLFDTDHTREFLIVVLDDQEDIIETVETDNIWVISLDIESGPIIHDTGVPTIYSLKGGYPNPFNSSTMISFGLPEAAKVRLTVCDISGREVGVVADAQFGTGYHKVAWSPAEMAPGIYFVRMDAGKFSSVKKLTFLK